MGQASVPSRFLLEIPGDLMVGPRLDAEAGEDRKQEGRAAGAKAWIVKPFQPNVMLDAVAKLVMA
jgi:hypothetical protein